MRLSGLLRGVLKSGEEFVTIGEELDLIEAYLDIERARFEDRLRVHIDVSWALRRVRIPAVVIQPRVWNGITPGTRERLSGGEVRICAGLRPALSSSDGVPCVAISVIDTGAGVAETTLVRQRARGF